MKQNFWANYGFILALLTALVLGAIFPQWGAASSPLPWTWIIALGSFVVFFLYGLKISFKAWLAALRFWPLHLGVQLTTFVVFPCLMYGLIWLGGGDSPLIWGLLFLSALPSTVSSSVVLVSVAGGHLPSAMFNASFSSLAGLIISPWLLSWLLPSQMGLSGDLTDLWLRLFLLILGPLCLGLLLHRYWGSWVQARGASLRKIDQTLICLIVFRAFAQAFERDMFALIPYGLLLALFLGLLALFFLILGLVNLLGLVLTWPWEHRIVAMFCASNKSLMHGAIMAELFFRDAALLGLVLLPLMMYHSLQLFLGGLLAGRWARKN